MLVWNLVQLLEQAMLAETSGYTVGRTCCCSLMLQCEQLLLLCRSSPCYSLRQPKVVSASNTDLDYQQQSGKCASMFQTHANPCQSWDSAHAKNQVDVHYLHAVGVQAAVGIDLKICVKPINH